MRIYSPENLHGTPPKISDCAPGLKRFLLDFWMWKMVIPDTHQMMCLMENMML
jgi:hypothetical protein